METVEPPLAQMGRTDCYFGQKSVSSNRGLCPRYPSQREINVFMTIFPKGTV